VSPWAYAIDYAVAIREDEAEIARLSDPRLAAVLAEMGADERSYFNHGAGDVYRFVTWRPERREARAAIFGLSEQDIRGLAAVTDSDPPFPTTPADWKHGKTLVPAFEGFSFPSSAERVKADLRRVKARLATHRRKAAQG